MHTRGRSDDEGSKQEGDVPGANRLHGQYSGQMLAKVSADVKRLLNFDRRSILISVRRSTIVYDGAPKGEHPRKSLHASYRVDST
jgi:hypothetical protein